MSEPSGSGVLVAVVDSGWNRARPDERVRAGVGLVDPVNDLALLRSTDDRDRLGHGTVCARLVLETAPAAEILPIRVFDRRAETSVMHLCAALGVALEHGAKVISMSVATHRTDELPALYAACDAAGRGGAIIVAAAQSARRPGFPAQFDNVIGVSKGAVANATDYRYDADAIAECAALGTPPGQRGDASSPPAGSGSFAAARIAGIVARFRELHPAGDLEAARAWLRQNSVS